MNRINVICTAIIVVASVVVVSSNFTSAVQQGRNSDTMIEAANNAARFEFAQLFVNGDEYLWNQGGLRITRNPVTVQRLISLLGGTNGGIAGFPVLLNTIGNNGWELVVVDQTASATRYLFQRPTAAVR